MYQLKSELGQFSDHPGITVIAKKFSDALDALKESVDWSVANYVESAEAASAGAVPLLRLFGVVCGAWMMARAAVIAKRQLDSGAGNEKFYRGKMATARFYVENILPTAFTFRDQIVGGSKTILALDESYF